MSPSVAPTSPSSSSKDTIILSPMALSPTRLRTIHLNTHIEAIDTRVSAICPSSTSSSSNRSSRRRERIQSDGTQDDDDDDSRKNTSPRLPASKSPLPSQPTPPSPPPAHSSSSASSTRSSNSPSPGSQGHPPPLITSLPATPHPVIPWSSPAVHPAPRLQRANSNPALGTAPLIVSPQPLRRRLSASPSPPSKLQTAPLPELLRRQGSGADLSPIDECRASECDGKRKARLEREAREQEAQAQLFSDGSEDEADGMHDEKDHPVEQDYSRRPREDNKQSPDRDGKKLEVEEQRPGRVHNCIRLARAQHKSYGRVFDDPFSAAVTLLVLPFCPPLSVYLTFRECGGLNRHRAREVGVAVILTVLGWVPGVVYALVVYFRHLPRPNDSQENQALHLSHRQRCKQWSDMTIGT